jgi:Flp pilus assembly protein TadG
MSIRRRRKRGQAIAELALALPVVVVLALGGADFGRAYFYRTPVSTAASAGARAGATGSNADIGAVVRAQSSALPNTMATWGSAMTADCTSAVSSQTCGDANGCTSGSSFWSTGTPNPVACFAVRSCTVDTTSSGSTHSGQCTAPGGTCTTASSGWSASGVSARPASGAAVASPPCLAALQVTVVYRFTAITPLIGNFFSGPGHALFISSTATALEQY